MDLVILNHEALFFFDSLILESLVDEWLLVFIQVEVVLACNQFRVSSILLYWALLLSFEVEILHIFLLFLHVVHDSFIVYLADILRLEIIWVTVLELLQLKRQLCSINAVDVLSTLQAAKNQVSLELKYPKKLSLLIHIVVVVL